MARADLADREHDCAGCEIGASAIYAPAFSINPTNIVEARQQVSSYRAHQIIRRPDDRTDYVCTLKRGWTSRSVVLADGRRQILGFMIPGDTLFFEALYAENHTSHEHMRALTDVTLCAFRPSSLREIVASSEIQSEVFARYVLDQKSLVERRLVDVGRRRALGRLARLVLELFTRLQSRSLFCGASIQFPLRQEDMADALGLTAAHVSRTLHELRRQGVLEVGKGRLQVLNEERLETIAADW